MHKESLLRNTSILDLFLFFGFVSMKWEGKKEGKSKLIIPKYVVWCVVG